MRVLVVDDEAAICEVLEMRLAAWGFEVLVAGDANEAQRLAAAHDPDLVISDIVLPEASGLDLLNRLKAGDPERPVVLITAHGSVDTAVEAMKRGAQDFLTKPLDYDKLRATVMALAEVIAERRGARRLEESLAKGAGLGALVGVSPPMQEVYRLVATVAGTDASVILTGETGTGKELAARAIHERSQRASGPFIALNVTAVPEGLFESELFGHERGSFTGAAAARAGCFELADRGTLFLDEVAEMPVAMQPKLLRVLEEGKARRVGGAQAIGFDVRVIAATNHDPAVAVADGRLREDLYYRLNVFTIVLPPLRARGGDVPLLSQHFIRQFDGKHGLAVAGLAAEARTLLEEYAWPGNVRELRNVIERAVILAQRGLISAAHLPPFMRGADRRSSSGGLVIPSGATAAEAERLLIFATLDQVGNNKAEAARRLGMDVKTIRNKLKLYGRGDGEQ